MGQRIKSKNGPSVLELQEVVIGSKLDIAAKLRIETAPASGIFVDLDFTTKEFACHVKDNLKADTVPDAVFTCTPRGNGIGNTGWIDLHMDGAETAKLSEREYFASLKVWPTGSPLEGDTFLVIVMPVKWEATR